MAQFFGKVKGGRGETTRCGTKNSGLRVDANGWGIGARVWVVHEDGKDWVYVYATTGSNGEVDRLIAKYSAVEEVNPI